MSEMAYTGEHHGNSRLVGGVDHLVIALAAARLDRRGGAGVDRGQETVGKREERLRSDDAGSAAAGLGRALDRELDRVDPARLAHADPDGGAAACEHDRVGLDVPAHLPGEGEIGEFLRRGRAAGGDAQLRRQQPRDVTVLKEEAAGQPLDVRAGVDRIG